MDDRDYEAMNKDNYGNDFIADVICCGCLEQLDLRWKYLSDQTKCMPHINNIHGDKSFRVNFCPVCGKNVRGVMIKP